MNVVDLMTLFTPDAHPHGMEPARFEELFTAARPVIFAFHGYQRAIHEVGHGRPNPDRFHVRGFVEPGTTTTPLDMVVINGMSRFHLCIEALRRSERFANRAPELIEHFKQHITEAVAYSKKHLEDMPAIRDWVWTVSDGQLATRIFDVRGAKLRISHCSISEARWLKLHQMYLRKQVSSGEAIEDNQPEADIHAASNALL